MALLAAILLLAAPRIAYADHFVVSNILDSGSGTLRQAISDAASGDTISFATNLSGATILLTNELPTIFTSLIISGPGSDNLTIARSSAPGTQQFRILTFALGNSILSGITISNGVSIQGAGLYNGRDSTLMMSNCVVSGNMGLFNGCGAGVMNFGNLTIIRSSITGNTGPGSGFYGGGIDNATGEGEIYPTNHGSLRIFDSIISANHSDGSGGGVFVNAGAVTISNCSISNNIASDRGGAICAVAGELNLINCSIVANIAANGVGAGICLQPIISQVNATIVGTTLNGNSASRDGGGIASFLGGGSHLGITNCTLSGNTSVLNGGGLWITGSAASIANCTIAGNTADANGGGIFNTSYSAYSLKNSIVAGNTNASSPDIGSDAPSSTMSLGHNLIGNNLGNLGFTNGVNGNIVGSGGSPVDPLLSPLQDNGGPTHTHALLSGSPAINAGDSNGAPAIDQRGFSRIASGAMDIGSFELQAGALTITCPSNLVTCTDPGESSAVVSFTPAVTGFPVPTVTCTPVSGTAFPVGTNLITCTASNSTGTATCSFTVTVLAPITVTPLTNQVAAVGTNVSFCTTASGFGPFQYQWYRNNYSEESSQLLNYQTNNCLILTNVTIADAAEYFIEVTGTCGSSYEFATLTIIPDGDLPALNSAIILCSDSLAAPNRVALHFSEPMDPGSASNPGNYYINGIAVTNAIVTGKLVTLETSRFHCGSDYPLTVTGLRDLSGNWIVPNPTTRSLTTTNLPCCATSYTLSLPAGYSVIANQLHHGSNGLAEVLPVVPESTTVAVMEASSSYLTWKEETSLLNNPPQPDFNVYTFSEGSWSGNPTLSPGSGFIIFLPYATNITFTGYVGQPVLPLYLTSNLQLVSSQLPTAAGYQDIAGTPPVEGVIVYTFVPGKLAEPIEPPNYLLHFFRNGHWDGGEPVAAIGEAWFIQKFDPIVIINQPVSQTNVLLGGNAAFSVNAAGTGPIEYQWRLNGVNIPGATGSALSLTNVQLINAGTYSVAVANFFNAVESLPAQLGLNLPPLFMTNTFTERATLFDASGLGESSNVGATQEFGEPNHAGKPGSKSMWIDWVAPANGIVTFSTVGSSFDTLLAVYTGKDFPSMLRTASDEDSGGFLTSLLTFNAAAGAVYHIAVDGYAGAEGSIILSWNLEPTTEQLPVVVTPPQNKVAKIGSTVSFNVEATGSLGVNYQWFFNGQSIPGATAPNLTIVNARSANAGLYFVRITNGRRSIDTEFVSLQFNSTGPNQDVINILAENKFFDAISQVQSGLASTSSYTSADRDPQQTSTQASAAAVSVNSGYTGSQTFSTYTAAKQPGEPNHCGITGGASYWFPPYTAPTNGLMTVSTDGSTFDTVLAVYTGPSTITNLASLVSVACDNDSGANGRTSKVNFPVLTGTNYFIVVDGVNAGTGTVKLSYAVLSPIGIGTLTSTNGIFSLQINTSPGTSFTIQRSTNFVNWTSLVSTNSTNGTFRYTDTNSRPFGRAYYRVVQ